MDINTQKYYRGKHNKAFLAVRQIINDIDPIGLIEHCGPEEYDIEVAEIVSKLSDCSSADDAKKLVINVFTRYFEDPGNLDLYEHIGAKILDTKKLLTLD